MSELPANHSLTVKESLLEASFTVKLFTVCLLSTSIPPKSFLVGGQSGGFETSSSNYFLRDRKQSSVHGCTVILRINVVD